MNCCEKLTMLKATSTVVHLLLMLTHPDTTSKALQHLLLATGILGHSRILVRAQRHCVVMPTVLLTASS